MRSWIDQRPRSAAVYLLVDSSYSPQQHRHRYLVRHKATIRRGLIALPYPLSTSALMRYYARATVADACFPDLLRCSSEFRVGSKGCVQLSVRQLTQNLIRIKSEKFEQIVYE